MKYLFFLTTALDERYSWDCDVHLAQFWCKFKILKSGSHLKCSLKVSKDLELSKENFVKHSFMDICIFRQMTAQEQTFLLSILRWSLVKLCHFVNRVWDWSTPLSMYVVNLFVVSRLFACWTLTFVLKFFLDFSPIF